MSGVLRKWKLILAVFFISMFWTAAGIWLVQSQSDKDRASEQIEQTKELAPVSELGIPRVDSEEIETEETEVKLLNVDLTRLIEKNPDTIGWIQVAGTSINYPFVQTDNNDFYQNHSFDKSRNSAGWPYLDAANAKDLSSTHSIIYLHGEISGSEFEPAKSIIANSSWINNPEQFVIRTSTESTNAIWQIFSIYKIETTDDYLDLSLAGDSLLSLVEKLSSRSVYNFNVPFTEMDKMLTFSIKYDNQNIVVIHAKLIIASDKNQQEDVIVTIPGIPDRTETPESSEEPEGPEEPEAPEDADNPMETEL